MPSDILNLAKRRVVLFDGAMGTELIRYGFKSGECPEQWNVDKSDIISSIYRSYFEAGADVVSTNSFGGSLIKLSSYDLGGKCYELNYEAAQLAASIRPEGKWVAGSIGPTGKFLKPVGEYDEIDFEDSFLQQIKGLKDGGVDILLMETQYDLREVLSAIRAAQKISDHPPIFATMTFNKTPRGFYTIMGNSVTQSFEELKKMGVEVIGANCTLDSKNMSDLVKIMRESTKLPILAQANAGQPSVTAKGVVYSQSLEDYVRYIPDMINGGANFIGGCCGTNPDYIHEMFKIINHRFA
jgi:5-methyltetrahydrofolate--homocysteine methyltransferase